MGEVHEISPGVDFQGNATIALARAVGVRILLTDAAPDMDWDPEVGVTGKYEPEHLPNTMRAGGNAMGDAP